MTAGLPNVRTRMLALFVSLSLLACLCGEVLGQEVQTGSLTLDPRITGRLDDLYLLTDEMRPMLEEALSQIPEDMLPIEDQLKLLNALPTESPEGEFEFGLVALILVAESLVEGQIQHADAQSVLDAAIDSWSLDATRQVSPPGATKHLVAESLTDGYLPDDIAQMTIALNGAIGSGVPPGTANNIVDAGRTAGLDAQQIAALLDELSDDILSGAPPGQAALTLADTFDLILPEEYEQRDNEEQKKDSKVKGKDQDEDDTQVMNRDEKRQRDEDGDLNEDGDENKETEQAENRNRNENRKRDQKKANDKNKNKDDSED